MLPPPFNDRIDKVIPHDWIIFTKMDEQCVFSGVREADVLKKGVNRRELEDISGGREWGRMDVSMNVGLLLLV